MSAGCAWLALHFLSYLLLSPLFNKLLEGNQAYSGNKKKKERAIAQMMPRVVCFIHNVIQVGTHIVPNRQAGLASGLESSTK